MIVRTNVKCVTCNKPITLRVQLPHSNREEIKFLCPHCKENLSIEVILDPENTDFQINAKMNCEKTDQIGPSLYLTTEIIPAKELVQNPFFSPAPFFVSQIENGDIQYYSKDKNEKDWELLYRAYNQIKLRNYDLSDNLLIEYCQNCNIQDTYTLKQCLYDHFIRSIGSSIYEKLEAVFKILGKQPHIKIIWLRNYIRKRYREVLPNFMIMVNEIYQNFNIHFPFIINIINGKESSDDMYYLLNDFNSIKQTYGNIFEVFSELIEVLACINNILELRDYDVFEKMNLDKYKTIDKAKRADPFKKNHLLYIFCEEFNSNLRNASHHGHIDYDKASDCIQYYTNNPSEKKIMPLKEYLFHINKLYLNSTSVFCIWLFISIAPD